MRNLLSLAFGLIAIGIVLSQCRRPWGWPGRAIVALMNHNHAALTTWALGFVTVGANDRVLDVGCGGGRTIHTLAGRATAGRIFGIDYSSASAAAAARHNRQLRADGRVGIARGTVSQLPFPAASFDLVTAVETHYYWPDLPADLREVLRTLKPGGAALVVAEAYKRSAANPTGAIMRALGGTYLSAAEHQAAFVSAGFVDVTIHEEPRRGWLSVVGRRPA